MFYILLVVLILSTGIWIWVDLVVIGKKNRECKKQVEMFNQRFADLEKVTETYPELKKRYNTKLIEFDSLKYKIPDNAAYVSVLESIRDLAKRQNVQIISISPNLSDTYPAIKSYLKFTGKHIERYTVQLQIYGDYLSIGAFLEELISMPMIVNVGKISLETELEESYGLSCELLLYTYIYFNEVRARA